MRYYSKYIWEENIPAPLVAGNAMAFIGTANSTARKFLSMGGGTTTGATGGSGGAPNYARVAKNLTSTIMVGQVGSGGGLSITTNGGTSFNGYTHSGTNAYGAIRGNGLFINITNQLITGPFHTGRSAAPPFTSPTLASNYTAGSYFGVMGATSINLIFSNTGTTGQLTGGATFTQPFAVSGADVAVSNNQFWCVRATGGHQVAWSTNSGGSWTTIVISASTTQTDPKIVVSDDNQKIFVVFDVNNAYSSTNGGGAWTGPFALPTGFSVGTLSGTKTLATIGACKSTANGTFFYSLDMGATWTEKVDGSTVVPFTALALWD